METAKPICMRLVISTLAFLTVVASAGELLVSAPGPPPDFLSPLQNLTVAQGRDVHFTCTVNNLGEYKVAWIKSDTKMVLALHTHMVTQNPRVSVTHNGHNTWKLYIRAVQSDDAGNYMCQLNTVPPMSQLGVLTVLVPPEILEGSTDQFVAEGERAELRCAATGVPPPTIHWTRDQRKPITIRDEEGNEIEVLERVSGDVVTLSGVRRQDSGTYWCIAANGVPPTKSQRYKLNVLFSPTVRADKTVVWGAVLSRAALECYVEATPHVFLTWVRGNTTTGDRLWNSSRVAVSQQSLGDYSWRSKLYISSLQPGDFGRYSCVAENAYGMTSASVMLREMPQTTTTTTTTRRTTTKTTTTTRPSTTRRVYIPPRTTKLPHRIQNTIETDMPVVKNELNSQQVQNRHNTTQNENTRNRNTDKQTHTKPRPRHVSGASSFNMLMKNIYMCLFIEYLLKILL